MTTNRLNLPWFGPYLSANVRDVVFATTAFSGAIAFGIGAMLIQPAPDAGATTATGSGVVAAAAQPAGSPVSADFDLATLSASRPRAGDPTIPVAAAPAESASLPAPPVTATHTATTAGSPATAAKTKPASQPATVASTAATDTRAIAPADSFERGKDDQFAPATGDNGSGFSISALAQPAGGAISALAGTPQTKLATAQ